MLLKQLDRVHTNVDSSVRRVSCSAIFHKHKFKSAVILDTFFVHMFILYIHMTHHCSYHLTGVFWSAEKNTISFETQTYSDRSLNERFFNSNLLIYCMDISFTLYFIQIKFIIFMLRSGELQYFSTIHHKIFTFHLFR